MKPRHPLTQGRAHGLDGMIEFVLEQSLVTREAALVFALPLVGEAALTNVLEHLTHPFTHIVARG